MPPAIIANREHHCLSITLPTARLENSATPAALTVRGSARAGHIATQSGHHVHARCSGRWLRPGLPSFQTSTWRAVSPLIQHSRLEAHGHHHAPYGCCCRFRRWVRPLRWRMRSHMDSPHSLPLLPPPPNPPTGAATPPPIIPRLKARPSSSTYNHGQPMLLLLLLRRHGP